MSRSTIIPNNPNYPYVTRSVIDLYNSGMLDAVDTIFVEPEYGYFVQLTYCDGSRRITFGNDLGLNTGSAEDIAKDKGYTKKILRQHGIHCPDGAEFILPWWQRTMARHRADGISAVDSSDMTTFTTDVVEYVVKELTYPIYIKPIDGSKGNYVQKVSNANQLIAALVAHEQARIRLAVVEETITLPDYRIVVLDRRLISAYRRVPLSVIGDGHSSIEELLAAKGREWARQGRDTHIDTVMARVVEECTMNGRSLQAIPGAGERVQLLPVSNLSLGGDAEDVTTLIDTRWVELACSVAASMGLRLAGVDLACGDITDGTAEYSVLEVNASPGLDHYAQSGSEQEKIVQSLYREVLNVSGYIHTLQE